MIDTKLLRQKILDLAIRGKLVPQDSNDEPACELLKKIKAEKEALIKAGKLKRDKHESFIFQGDDKRYYEQIDGKTNDISGEIPFDVPDGWAWSRMNVLASSALGKMLDARKNRGIPMPYLRNINVRWGSFDLSDLLKMRFEPSENERYGLEAGDLVVCEGGEPGRCAVWMEERHDMKIQKALHRIRPHKNVSSHFLFYVFQQYAMSHYMDSFFTGSTIKHLTGEAVSHLLVPLPPCPEQKRIVVQIESLLKCVDEIDKESETLEKSITLAKQKILALAIRGKLVPQDPKDEPASELLKKIKAEKDALIKAGKLKRDKHESIIFRGDDNCYYEQIDGKTVDVTAAIPFEIPESWCWCRLGSLCDYGKCQSVEPSEIKATAWVLDLEDIEKDSGRLLCRIEKQNRLPTSSKHVFNRGNVLYSKLRTYLNKVLVADQDGYCTSEILPLDFGKYILPEFARCVLMSKMFLDYTARCGYGVKMPRLGTEDGRKALFPLPPMQEQARIICANSQYESILKSLRG